MREKTLKSLKGDLNTTLGILAKVQELLISSGVQTFLMEGAQVRFTNPNNPNFQALEASEAARSRGYLECLQDIMYFKERYCAEETLPPADFGAAKILEAEGTLTEEDKKLLTTFDVKGNRIF